MQIQHLIKQKQERKRVDGTSFEVMQEEGDGEDMQLDQFIKILNGFKGFDSWDR